MAEHNDASVVGAGANRYGGLAAVNTVQTLSKMDEQSRDDLDIVRRLIFEGI